MFVKIVESLIGKPMMLRLNSGPTLHLRPRATSKEIRNEELENNAKVKKLLDQHVIKLHTKAKKSPPKLVKKKSPATKIKRELKKENKKNLKENK